MYFKKRTFMAGLITLMILCSKTYSKEYHVYISPGITFGWNFGNKFTVTPKLGVGIFKYENGQLRFFNLTYGVNNGPGKRVAKPSFESIHFLEVQGGSNFAGGGVGIAILKSGNETHYCPKLTAFGGLGFFLNMDMTITPNGLNTNLGIQPNIPIPLERPNFSSD